MKSHPHFLDIMVVSMKMQLSRRMLTSRNISPIHLNLPSSEADKHSQWQSRHSPEPVNSQHSTVSVMFSTLESYLLLNATSVSDNTFLNIRILSKHLYSDTHSRTGITYTRHCKNYLFFRDGGMEGANCLWRGWGFDFTNLFSFFGLFCSASLIISPSPWYHTHLDDQQAVVPLDHVERVLSRVIPDLEGALRRLHGWESLKEKKCSARKRKSRPKRKSCKRKTLIAGRRFRLSGTSWSQSKRWSLPLVWWKVRLWRRLGENL